MVTATRSATLGTISSAEKGGDAKLTLIKEAVYTRPKLYPKQREAIFVPERYALIEAST